jgi:tetratricopeptide (TPR) repeat protein
MKTTPTILASFLAVFLVLGLLAAPLEAQKAPQKAPAAPAPASPAGDVNKSIQDAAKMANTGNLAGAIQKLEAVRKSGAVTPLPALSLLGALYLQANRPQEALNVLKPLADAEAADPAVLYNAGRAARALGQNNVWIGYLQRAARLAPGSPATRDLGFVYMGEGQVVEAYALLRTWARQNPSDSEARITAASLAIQLERPQEAEELILNMPQSNPAILLLRGRIQVQKGDGPGGLALLEPLLAKHPQGMDLEVRRSLSEAYLLANRPADAVKILTGKAGNHPALVLLLGRAQHRAGNAPAAIATLKPLVDKLPADASTVGDPRPAAGIAVEYGSVLVDSGRAAEAVPILEQATRLYSNSRDAWQTLAKAYDAAGRKADGAKARAQSEQIALAAAHPQQPPPARPSAPPVAQAPSQRPAAAGPAAPAAGPQMSQNMQDALKSFAAGKGEQALAAVRREIAQTPNNRQARALELRILLGLNRSDEALRMTDERLRLRPNDPDLVYQRGVIQMSRKSFVAAEKDLRHALELNPQHTGAMNDLAVLLSNQGKKTEAQALLQKALQLNPQDQNAAANLAALQNPPAGKKP